MRLKILFAAMILSCCLWQTAFSQESNRIDPGQEIPSGVVVYSLPSTTLRLEAEALCESFIPGPYAEFAKKYLGIDVPQKEYTEYNLIGIKLTPYIEADRSCSYIANLSGFIGKAAPVSFLKFSSQGLLSFSDANTGSMSEWRFPSLADQRGNIASEATENLTSTETTLYRTVKNAAGDFEKVAAKQSSVVVKSPEAKAKEAASMIFSLREQRVNIITGNTDATFSGDALRAAVEEITKLEEEYMKLFTGISSSSVQKMYFDVVPNSLSEDELVIAFRLSNTLGLLPADDISGRPIVVEISPEDPNLSPTETEQYITESESQKGSRAKHEAATRGSIFYRIPSICKIKVTDGTQLLLQSRAPIYQKGILLSFPISVMVQ